MAIKIYGVFNAENQQVMTLQGKRLDTMEKAVQDYVRDGRLPSGEYTVRLIAEECR